jgi:hypothetical protein
MIEVQRVGGQPDTSGGTNAILVQEDTATN